jgi:hypothetical protein
MGLLDDAIREHLDLKRRRGADPSEVARLEHEALGPVRREPTPEAAAEEHHDAPDAAEDLQREDRTRVLPPEERHEPPHGDPLFEQHAHNVELGGAAAEPVERAAPAEPEPARREPPSRPEPPREQDAVDQPTTEYRVEDHYDEEPDQPRPQAPEGEDVLEETPDFLQETPEHDRLWFEQRPPRDFDFDG